LLIAYPMLLSLDLSFQNVGISKLGDPRKPYTLLNYRQLVTSSEFWQACWVTLRLVVIVTASCMVLGVGTALLVNNSFRGRSIARFAVALPWAIPEIVAVVVFTRLFDSSFGVVNWALVRLGLVGEPVNWFSSPQAAFIVVCVVMIWKGYPFVSIMALAGLQAIPEELYAAGKVDGAKAWQRLVYITLPMMVPVFGVILVLVVLWVFRDFSIVYLLTGGGPVRATQTLSVMTYQQAFSFFHMGYASAIGIVTLVFCVILSRFLIGRSAQGMY
jgi:multiple sugar transport system permease protein